MATRVKSKHSYISERVTSSHPLTAISDVICLLIRLQLKEAPHVLQRSKYQNKVFHSLSLHVTY